MQRAQKIQLALQSLHATELQIQDDSQKHAGHAGARDGRGHFTLRIISSQFEGLNLLRRHRLVYGLLSELLITDIHALALVTKAPSELLRDL